MPGLPSGLVTFLFTDIEGSTELFAARPDDYPQLLEQHNRAMRGAIEAAGGAVVSTDGDAFFAAFDDPTSALNGAANAQRAITAIEWPEGAALRVRMGLHTGVAHPTNDNYVAFCVHQAARVVTAGYGGQIVLSSATEKVGKVPAGLRLVPRGRFQLRDFPEPEPLFTLEGDGLPPEQPGLRARTERNENLPTFRTGLLGRANELEAVGELLSTARVVTLTGPGGVGKTRTATAVASEQLPHCRDGVWFCALDTVTDPSRVPHAVAESMGKRLSANADTSSELARLVGDSQTLVVVDNCEHVLDAAAQVIDALIRECPELRVLATSQAPLEIEGEHIFRLDPLGVEGDTSPALALFIERATSAGAGWTNDVDELRAAAEIVQRLDGMPLAIELAAARAASLTPREIELRLDQQFTIVSSARRDLLPRRRALLATIEWSYGLLDAPDAALLRRLAYFAGSFDLDGAEAMATAQGLEPLDAIESVSTLVVRSLVSLADTAEGRRFRLLDSIRAFGLQQAERNGESQACAYAHAAWVRGRLPKMERLEDLELDPIVRGQAAARWHNDIALAADRLITAAAPYAAEFCWRASPVWIYLLRVEEGMRRLTAAAELADDDYHRGRCLQSAAHLAQIAQLPHWQELYPHAADVLAATGATSNDPIAVAYAAMATHAAATIDAERDPAAAEALLARATRFAQRIDYPEVLASVASTRAQMAFVQRDYTALDALSLEHVALARRTKGQPYGRALRDRAAFLWELGRFEEGDELMLSAVAALEGEPAQAATLRNAAYSVILASPDSVPAALDAFERAEAIAAHYGLFDEVVATRNNVAGVHAYAGDRAASRAAADEAMALATDLNLPGGFANCELTRARIALVFGDVDDARQALGELERLDQLADWRSVIAAAIAIREGDAPRARHLLASVGDALHIGDFGTVAALAAAALNDPRREQVIAAAHADRPTRSFFSLHQLRDLGPGRGDFTYPRDALDFIVRWVGETADGGVP